MRLLPLARRSSARRSCLIPLRRTQDTALFDLAEPVLARLQNCSKRRRRAGIVIIASLFERRASGIYHNTAAVIDADGRYLGKYRKMHIPQDPG